MAADALDKCPKCEKRGMPIVYPNEKLPIARQCQICHYIEELKRDGSEEISS